MSMTAETTHDPIGPCGLAEQSPIDDSSMHASTASRSSVLFWGTNAAVPSVRKAFEGGVLRVMVRTLTVIVFAAMVVEDAAVVVLAAIAVHTVVDIDPGDLRNILSFFAFEFTQETPQSI